MAEANWNWRISAHCRLASLATVWLLIFAAPVIGPGLQLLIAGRFVASSGQLLLNRRLAARSPIEGRDRADWLLFAATFLAACGVSALQQEAGLQEAPWLLAAVALPFSVIQLRSCARAYRAHERRREPALLPANTSRSRAA